MLKTIKNGLVKTILASVVIMSFMNYNNAKAYTTVTDCQGDGQTSKTCVEFQPNEYYSYNSDVNMILPNWQFIYFGDENYKTNYHTYQYETNMFMFWYSGALYSVVDGNAYGKANLYQINKVCKYTGNDLQGIYYNCLDQAIGQACYTSDTTYTTTITEFKNAVNGYTPSKFIYLRLGQAYEGGALCGVYGDITYCIRENYNSPGGYICTGQATLVDEGIAPLNSAFAYYSPYFGNSPLTAGSTNYPTISGAETQPNGTTTYMCPTIQQLLNTYPSEYKPSNCKTSTRVYINGQATATGSKTIFDLYENYQFFHQDRSSYKAYCKNIGYTGACASMFNSKPFEYNLISKLDTDKLEDGKLRQYCNLELNYPKNATTCTTSGSLIIPGQTTGTIHEGITITNEGIIQEIINGDYTPILPGGNYNTGDNGTTGSTADSVWDLILKAVGDDEGTGENNTETLISNGWDILDNLNQVYTKITGIFQGRSGKQGIIPGVVGIILLVIVLFKIFKK